jgi:hypothetical protein
MKPSSADASPRSRGSGRRASIAALAVTAASWALLAAGCGGSSGASGAKVAQVDSTQATTTAPGLTGRSKRDALVAFSACMRKNGVPKFPDPEVVDGGMRLSFGSENGIDPNAPQFKKAQQACRNLLPNGGRSTPQEQAKELQKALDFAACMRSHGVPKFPDPKASSDGGIDMGGFGPGTGVDPNSPQFQAAQRECQKLVPGGPPPVRPGPGKSS